MSTETKPATAAQFWATPHPGEIRKPIALSSLKTTVFLFRAITSNDEEVVTIAEYRLVVAAGHHFLEQRVENVIGERVWDRVSGSALDLWAVRLVLRRYPQQILDGGCLPCRDIEVRERDGGYLEVDLGTIDMDA